MTRRPAASVVLAAAIAVAAIDPQRLDQWSGLQPAALSAFAFSAALLGQPEGQQPPHPRAIVWISAWLGWSVVGAALSQHPGTALLSVASFAAIALATLNLTRYGSAIEVGGVLTLAGAFSIAAAFLVEVVGHDGGFSGRFQLLFLEPNQLARAAAIVLVALTAVLTHRFLESHDLRTIAPLVFGCTASTLVLFLTQSRTGVAAAAVGVLIVVSAQLSRRLSIAALAAVALVLAGGAIAVLTDSAGESINQSLSRSDSAPTDELRTLNGRTVLWPEVVDVAMERPVTGVGLGLDRQVIAPFRAEGRVVWSAQHTHSLPLQLWLTTGVPGLFLLTAAIVAASKGTWITPHSAERTLALGLLGVIVVDGIVEPVLRVPSFAWLGLLVAASLTQSRRSAQL